MPLPLVLLLARVRSSARRGASALAGFPGYVRNALTLSTKHHRPGRGVCVEPWPATNPLAPHPCRTGDSQRRHLPNRASPLPSSSVQRENSTLRADPFLFLYYFIPALDYPLSRLRTRSSSTRHFFLALVVSSPDEPHPPLPPTPVLDVKVCAARTLFHPPGVHRFSFYFCFYLQGGLFLFAFSWKRLWFFEMKKDLRFSCRGT